MMTNRKSMATGCGTDKEAIGDLSETLAGLGDARSMEAFLRSILTPREASAIGLRWRIVCLLQAGMTQRAIAARLGVSLCKVTRGARELKQGPTVFKQAVCRTVREGQNRGISGKQELLCD